MALDLAALDGLRIDGGCEHCNAVQQIDAHWGGAHIHRLTIYHDDSCPQINKGNRATRRATRHRRP